MPSVDISLQPKQWMLYDLIVDSPATVIGDGGGRGAAKSGGADRIAIQLGIEQPGCVIAIVMRNSDQVRKFHFEQIKRDFPELEPYAHGTHMTFRMPVDGRVSEIQCGYAESLEDIKRRFRSGNIRYLFVDQAEQFTWEELTELGLAVRSTGGVTAKLVLLFNMGGIGIEGLRNHFGPVKKFNEHESPEDYAFLHVYPWDNVEWARSELEKDGLTEEDYYSWSHEKRREYFVTRTAYGKKLNALDASTRARDLDGDWKSLEGAYFGEVYDDAKTMIDADTVQSLINPWDIRWLSTDWGKTHYCSTHWHARTLLSPGEAKKVLGWDVVKPLNVIVTYRRLIVSGQTSIEVARHILEKTPVHEREKIKRYPFSPEQFGERDSEDTVPILIGRELRKFGMPHPEIADNSRKPGWELMYTLLNNTRIWGTPRQDRTAEMEQNAGDTVWLICSECPELLDYIPLLMRNPKDLDDVVKTDLSQTDMKMDVADDVRYGLLSMLGARKKPESVVMKERVRTVLAEHGATAANIEYMRLQDKRKGKVPWRRQS